MDVGPWLLTKAEEDLKRGISLGFTSIGRSEWMMDVYWDNSHIGDPAVLNCFHESLETSQKGSQLGLQGIMRETERYYGDTPLC